MADVVTLAGKKRPMVVDPQIFRPDPHVGFAAVRPQAGVIEVGGPMKIVTRYADVAALMTDPRTRQIETEPLVLRGVTEGALFEFYAHSMLTANPPRHAARRRPAAKTFAHKLINAWRPRIRGLVHELLDAVEGSDDIDVLDAIASPLPSRLIAEVLGAPDEDAAGFAAKVYKMSRGLGVFKAEEFDGVEAAAAALKCYVETLLAERRQSPRDDFLTDYLRKVDEAGDLCALETINQIVALIIAGSDTTRFTLTFLLYNLLNNRSQWRALCEDPGLAPGAVLETLRYEPPVGAIGRVAVEPIEIDGVLLPAGAVLSLSVLSAQRDEAVFADPQCFDIRRNDHPRLSLTFGLGAHRCLGEALARAELEEAILAISQRAPDLRLVGPGPVAKGQNGIRGVTQFHVAWA